MVWELSAEERHERASRAARDGWQTRRAGMTPHRRFWALHNRVADGPARALCCDLAERVALPIYREAYPDDPRPELILWTARRYARGEASERERCGMRQIAVARLAELDPLPRPPRTRASVALQAIAWCLDRPTRMMIGCVWDWLRHLVGEATASALLDELVAALAAMPTRSDHLKGT